jgi:hypothetical protein
MPTLVQNGLSIVAVGDFNTRIFQPAWFSSQKLISEMEANAPTELFVSDQLATFRLPWLLLRVIPKEFVALTVQDSHFEPLRDLVIGTFRLLRHTPITQLGINVEQHYLFENVEEWNNFGHKLAPKALWKESFKDPGLLAMTMQEKAGRTGGPPGTTNVDVQSSVFFRPGVFFRVNNHYHFEDVPPGNTAEAMVKVLEVNLAIALDFSKRVIDNLLKAV